MKAENEAQLKSRRVRVHDAFSLASGILSSRQIQDFADFETRLRMVENLSDIRMPSSSKDLQDAYFVLLKIALAWSALERISHLTEVRGNFSITSKPLSNAIKSGEFNQLLDALRENRTADFNPGKSLRDIRQGIASTRLNGLAKEIRNGMFHGAINPTRVGIARSQRRRALLLGLANAVLDSTVEVFENWVKKQIR